MHKKKRRKAYRNLINALLNCKEGEEWQLLEEHSKLLDAHFIQMMQKVAEELEEKGDEERADFLWYLADALVYQEIIAQLLNCASDEEAWQVLNANRELVDEGLVQMMIQAAEALEEEGDHNRADFLSELARQLAELLRISGNVAADNPSLTASSEEYHNFLRQLLLTVAESNGNPEIVYPFLRQNLDKLNLNFSSTIQQLWQNTLPNIEASLRNDLAPFVFELGNLFQQFPFKKHICLEISIACYQLALQEWRQDNLPLDWAKTQNNLALAYCDRIAGDRRENLEQAIACYQLAKPRLF